MSGRKRIAQLAATAAGTALATCLAALTIMGTRAPAEPGGDEAASSELRQDLWRARDLSRAFRYGVEQIKPSVVHITTSIEQYGWDGRRGRTYRHTGSALGSGVIASRDGYIITNNHVIDGATSLSVRLMDGREHEARLIGRDPATDLAVLKVDASGLTPAHFADSDNLAVGEWVLAVGSPFGFSQTVTSGIISAMGRTGLSRSDHNQFEDFIQTDAAINPGNSGGPLVDVEGRVVGINTAIFSRSGGSNGIGFAIPSNIVQTVFEDITEDGAIERGWLGVSMLDVQRRALRDLGITGGGVYIDHVEPGSPADKAGLKERDIVVSIDGKPTPDSSRLRTAIALRRPGAEVELEVYRRGERTTLSATLGDSLDWVARRFGGVAAGKFGLIVEKPTSRELSARGLQPDLDCVVVRHVLANSPAARASVFAEGDLILQVEDKRVHDEEEFLEFAQAAELDDGVRLDVVRATQRGRLLRDVVELRP